jgi:hypothetical protein
MEVNVFVADNFENIYSYSSNCRVTPISLQELVDYMKNHGSEKEVGSINSIYLIKF